MFDTDLVEMVGKIATPILMTMISKMLPDFKKRFFRKNYETTIDKQRKLDWNEYVKKQYQLNPSSALTDQNEEIAMAKLNVHFNMRQLLLQDAIRNFPLNISPLVLLENNDIDIDFLLGKSAKEELLYDTVYKSLDKRPLSVFIMPIHVDSRVNEKELIVKHVSDDVYSALESVFINEYGRDGNRPVIFYSTAWNKNFPGGLHAAEELYYFLKNLPTLVVEPRYDGKKLKTVFSCWGLGYSSRIHFRQEIPLNFDWNSLLVTAAYERSKQTLNTYQSLNLHDESINEQKMIWEHDINMFAKIDLKNRLKEHFEEIQLYGESSKLDELGNYAKLFHIKESDVVLISKIVSEAIGMLIAIMSDIHHLLASGIQPQLPCIYRTYFKDCMNDKVVEEANLIYAQIIDELKKEQPKKKNSLSLKLVLLKKQFGVEYEKSEIDALKDICKAKGGTDSDVQSWDRHECYEFIIKKWEKQDDYGSTLYALLDGKEEEDKKLKVALNSVIIK